jgi:hypothetical protein
MMRKWALHYGQRLLVITVCTWASLHVAVSGAQRAAAAPAAGANAPFDITGYWVSVVTEDWRYRMVTPKRGEYPNVPITPEAKKIADTWDPAKDTSDGAACKAYGAPSVMRLPTRLHITWQDPTTLKIEADNGTQTRLIHLLGPQATTLHIEGMPIAGFTATTPSWQGDSIAQWDGTGTRPKSGSLKVVTRNLKPGYLQKNGVPYSSSALLTEYFDRLDETNGDSWLIDLAMVEDPQYLRAPYTHSTHFKREADGAKWDPSPCVAK